MIKSDRILLLFILLFLLIQPVRLFAFSIHCVSVGPSGDVTLQWDTNGAPSVNFRSWHLYHSTNKNGPFSVIDSVNTYNTNTRAHPTANAATNPAYYIIAYKSNNASPDIVSDTVRAIGLLINNSGSGSADLSWSPIHIPLIASNSPYYLIYREYPAGVFTLIDSVDARTSAIPMTYSDLISICDDTIKYMIMVKDSFCTSVSAIKGDRFFDLSVPAIPVIDSVSVDLAGNVIVSWKPSTSFDTHAYIIYEFPSQAIADTVYGINSTTLTTTINATLTSKSFEIVALDSCNNSSAFSDVHSTIYLLAGFDLCTQSATLNWSAYDFWGTQPQYDILVSVNGGAEVLIGTTTATTFIDTNLTSGSSFCYRVRALENGSTRTTTSNRSCLVPNFPPPPAFSYIRKVTVTGTDEVNIIAYVDPGPTVSGYKLLRSESQSGPFSTVATITITGVSTVSFLDNIPTDQGPYFYFVTTIDSCGTDVLSSQISNTILLTGVANGDYTNDLTWTEYTSWPTNVDQYNIYLSTNGVVSAIPITTVSSLQLAFIDSVLDNFYSDGEFCYIIEAVESPGNPNFFRDSSRSNEICLQQSPLIFIPNAFHPGGQLNENFYPSNAFVSAADYSFDIFNRWGENIFHTNDPHVGWNGTTNQISAPEGVYIYRLKAKNSDGTEIDKVGSVTLIR